MYLSCILFRFIRSDDDLFELLIASKDQRMNGEPDFKTLADVLIQSVFRHGVKSKVRGVACCRETRLSVCVCV